MTVFINGEAREFDRAETLSGILESLGLPGQRIAIEHNRSVVRKQDWETTAVSDGDKIEIVHFVGGG